MSFPRNQALRSLARAPLRFNRAPLRHQSSAATPQTSPFAPRHLLSIADLTPKELTTLIRNAATYKQAIKSGFTPNSIQNSLTAKTVAVMFSKRSTRTRVSTESAIVTMGGHPMFLGAQDIQLGVNESLYDTTLIISSMVSAIVARVNAHSDVADMAKHSSVPVINALSDLYHPLQTLADFLTVHEAFPSTPSPTSSPVSGLGIEGLKIAWVGDANNVLFDLAIAAMKLGVDVRVATPKGYEIPGFMRQAIQQAGSSAPRAGSLQETNVPEEAVKDADIIVTDTWVSMGQEEEKTKRLKAFEGFQVTADLAKRGGAKEGWQFMHCLPRHPEEVSDEVFYSPKSLVFQEGENRLWAAISALEGFVVNKGQI
ncbi:MAG: ornithine carbamoyltransferase [Bathelium mastoideum]|nr:MAG: ornithine carbamoyltransferase [Bathelium mastoideum]